MLGQIGMSAARIDHLILDALDHGKVLRGNLPIRPVDVGPLLYSLIEAYPRFQSPEAEIRIQGIIPAVPGNQIALAQCFSNLLDNAVKFVDPGCGYGLKPAMIR
jgi:signal transduction histidine kinase